MFKKGLLFGFLLYCINLHAQDNQGKTVPLFFEKVYLHTDRDVYAQGEDIWFKAYLVNAQNNTAINYSHNLYAELISPGLKIITRHVIRLEDGFGNGNFTLQDTLSPGEYRIRAYTNWMRNFGDNFIFEKQITIVNASHKQASIGSLAETKTRMNKQRIAIGKQDTLPPGPMVRFFPEGGAMVNSVASVVAVRAENQYGKGIPATGTIMSEGKAVAKFICDSLGMGEFSLTPERGQKYHALVSIDGQPKIFELHNALSMGFVMSVNVTSSSIFTTISCNTLSLSESGNTKLIVVARHGGKTIYKDQIVVNGKEQLIQIPDTNFPEGIACITLYDERFTALCERLVYIHHPVSAVLTLNTDKVVYQPKEKVAVKIKLGKNERANLSVAVMDESVSEVRSGDILSYLTLSSEVKGNIEHPERYFDTTNINRFKQLNLLLLTQGWRSFIWTRLADTTLKLSYDVEQSISITGQVRDVWLKKATPKINITMFAPKAVGAKLFSAVSDSAGRFRIDGAVLYGYQYLSFTSRSSKGIKDNGQSRGKSGGWIIVDSLNQDRLPVSPVIVNLANTTMVKAGAIAEREMLKKKFSFTGDNTLNTVQIKTYSRILPPEVHQITMAEQKDFGTLGQYVIYNIPGAYWFMPGPDGNPRQHDENPFLPPIIKVGGNTLSVYGTYSDHSKIIDKTIDDDYWGLPMDRVLKVIIKKRQTIEGIYYSVQVLLRPGALEIKDTFDNTMADVVGYSHSKVFYAPRYDRPDNKPDYRTTIHWEPNITTNAQGEATVTYYNADPKTRIRIIAEGVTDKGIPVVATTEYEVK